MRIERLVPHARTACPAVERIEVGVSRQADTLILHFKLVGDVTQLSILPRRTFVCADELWRHTCFEAFVARVDGEGYCEFNLSPSHQWAIYAFDRYREGMRPMPEAGLQPVVVGDGPGYLSLDARIELRVPDLAGQDWRVGLCAVVEDATGNVSYWALTHPGEKPDFHDRNGFVLTLPA